MNIQKQFGCQVLTHVGETATVENSNFDVDDFWILMLNAWVMIDRFECLLNNLEHKTWFVFFFGADMAVWWVQFQSLFYTLSQN